MLFCILGVIFSFRFSEGSFRKIIWRVLKWVFFGSYFRGLRFDFRLRKLKLVVG